MPRRPHLGGVVAAIREDGHGDPFALGGTQHPVADVVACTAGGTQSTAGIPGLQSPQSTSVPSPILRARVVLVPEVLLGLQHRLTPHSHQLLSAMFCCTLDNTTEHQYEHEEFSVIERCWSGSMTGCTSQPRKKIQDFDFGGNWRMDGIAAAGQIPCHQTKGERGNRRIERQAH